MTAEKYLNSKGIYGLDTKKRFNEVLNWLTEFAEQEREKAFKEAREGEFHFSNFKYESYNDYKKQHPLT